MIFLYTDHSTSQSGLNIQVYEYVTGTSFSSLCKPESSWMLGMKSLGVKYVIHTSTEM